MCLWGADSSHSAGSSISAGLPNITGHMRAYSVLASVVGEVANGAACSYTGAFYSSETGTGYFGTNSGSANWRQDLGMDASKSNSIYGKSSTVQPPAFVVNIWKRTA